MSATTYLPAERLQLGDRYLVALAIVLCGYAVSGKGFAYLGVAPLYVGEILLGIGLLVMFASGCMLAAFTNLPNLLLAMLCAWVAVRAVPYVGTHGMDALRDAVVAIYGAFAFITCAVLLQRPERLATVLRLFAVLALIYGCWGWAPYVLASFADMLPGWPGSGLPLVQLRPGEVAVHLAGAAVFALLFFQRVHWAWLLMLLAGIGLTAAQSRGGLLAIALPLCFAIVMTGKVAQAAKVLIIGIVVASAAAAVFSGLELGGTSREINLEQIALNALSIFSDTSEAGLDGTKAWRLNWWDDIIGYTIHGEYFWTGKGFGISLAESDGYQGTILPGVPILRSPHNAHMTMLARAGVPGLVLWLGALGSWGLMMLRGMILARRRGEELWFRLFLFLLCYLGAIIVNASFDVALEGPMLGIWFWVLFGLGSACAMIYQQRLDGGRAIL
ncbi:O-antigen ligase family protein [Roseomonas frigidaquae]|uniref:O-antigen ligase family protein n=1 Tax=Falsiroseomonas frigidaquae TaxID=487318 RepID=A0ABX1EU34_9PROT|nr:O-antigen ligase family protein [Falsiroseomonas frigidaquae]NKE44144.1 O-antigen ligase family protein [Falsiroseomonas frigidaquae]